MDKIIFVFTSENSLTTVGRGFGIDEDELPQIDWDSPHKIAKGVHLLSDSQNKEDFEKFWSCIETIINENKNVSFIHHTKPDNSVIQLIQKKGYKTYSGSHEDGINGYRYYKPLKRLLTENHNEEEILQEWYKIFDSENTLEQSLKLLHDIYTGKPKKDIRDQKGKITQIGFESLNNKGLREQKDNEETYKLLVGDFDDWKYDHTQHARLTDLRDILLSKSYI